MILAGLMGCGVFVPALPEVADPCAEWAAPGLYDVRLDTTDGTRRPMVYVPASKGPRDLVVLLHGAGGNGRGMLDVTAFRKAADEEGFVVLIPNGQGFPTRAWNADDDPDGADLEADADDVSFLDRLVDEVSPQVCGARTLGVGFSNGAMMVHRWGCESTVVDAVAPVAGPLLLDACPGPPRPLLGLHGTADEVVPIDGGEGGFGYTFPAIDETIGEWRRRNQCAPDPAEVVRNGDTTCTFYDCAVSTAFCRIEAWPHRWPGGANTELTEADATRRIWDWFAALE